MRKMILSALVALSLLAVVFCAVPANAAVYYTGSVQTTDNAGTAKSVYYRGEQVYVAVELNYMGDPAVADIRVELRRADGSVMSFINARTDNPEDGKYNSWLPPVRSLATGAFFAGDFVVYDVVLLVDWGWGWREEVTRTQIIVKKEGFTLDPDSWWYYPGETVTMTLMTRQTPDFYVQVVNETYVDYLNWTNLEAVDGYWSDTWIIPSDIPDGTYTINVRGEVDDAIWYSRSIDIQAFVMLVTTDRYSYLPGETVQFTYQVIDVATFQVHTGITIEWNATWTNVSGNETYDWGTLAGASGVVDFLIPADIALYSDVMFTFWANDTQGRTADAMYWISIEMMSVSIDLGVGPYVPGEKVELEVHVDIGWDNMPGASVAVKVEKGGIVIAAYGATGLTTDVYGDVKHSFSLASDASLGTYLVTATVSKLGYEITTMATFIVEREASFEVEFEKGLYHSGESATVLFEVMWNGQVVTGYPIFYLIYTSLGLLTTGSTNGSSATVSIPSDYTGYISVEAVVNINGNMMDDWDDANVIFASVVVTALADEYRPGDTVTFVYQIVTGVTSGTAEYAVYDDTGSEVASGVLGAVMSGSFQFGVPSQAARYYTAEVTYTDGSRTATGSDTVWLLSEYELVIWIKSSSGYASGAFEPGSVITVGYEIKIHGATPAAVYKIVYGTWMDDVSYSVLVTSLTGELTYTIPQNAADATVYFYADLYDAVENDWLYDSVLTFRTESSLSSWDKSVAGMSAIDFTILLLIVIMVLLLIIVPFLRGRSGVPKAPKAEPMPPAPPMAEEPPKPQ